MHINQILDQQRVFLANLPTPLESAAWTWEKRRLFVKRDDLTGIALSGNKVRKLEYLFADAQAQGCDTVLTCGGVQSNHARATAVAACRLGLKCALVLPGDTPEVMDGNLLLDRMVGADVHIPPAGSKEGRDQALAAAADRVRSAGGRPYIIPTGGSNEIGALGYIQAGRELAADCAKSDCPADVLVVAVGSGGTFAGLFLAARLFGLKLRVVGATVDETPAYWRPYLADYLERCISRWDLDVSFQESEIELLDAAGRGYAVSDPAEIDFIARFARRTALFLDPVYTGKAMFVLDREIRAGNLDPTGDILFVHTGGIFGLFPERDMLTTALNRP
ncbi:MAG: D-cysteine desulfhydrase family protein [bacterium]|nr:D-cysteine desulfhydrase family protein [bacterium]